MRIAGIADAVDAFAGGVQGGVKADGVIGIAEIVVDRAGHADGGQAQLAERARALEGAVAADADEAFDAQRTHVFNGALLVLDVDEFIAARSHQEGAAAVNLARNAAGGENGKIIMFVRAAHQHAVVAALEADHGHIVLQTGSHNGADRCIHAGRVAAGSKYANSLHK